MCFLRHKTLVDIAKAACSVDSDNLVPNTVFQCGHVLIFSSLVTYFHFIFCLEYCVGWTLNFLGWQKHTTLRSKRTNQNIIWSWSVYSKRSFVRKWESTEIIWVWLSDYWLSHKWCDHWHASACFLFTFPFYTSLD